MDTESLLISLSKAVSFAFQSDGTAPAVLVSHLKDGQVYVSVVRYGSQFSRGKQVVCNTYDSNLRSALVKVSETFLGKVQAPVTNPIDSLRELMK